MFLNVIDETEPPRLLTRIDPRQQRTFSLIVPRRRRRCVRSARRGILAVGRSGLYRLHHR
jgi:hypothetical protein